jgi:hypothetical protein
MESATFLDALRLASGSLAKNEYVPILTQFCFEDDYFYAFNEEHATVVNWQTGLQCGLPGAALLDHMKLYRGATLDIKRTKDHIEFQSTSRKKLRLLFTPKKDFVYRYPELSDTPRLMIVLPLRFIEGLELALESVSKAAIEADWAGVTLLVGEDRMCLCSTDNMTMVLVNFNDVKIYEYMGGTKSPMSVIPKGAVEQICRVHRTLRKSLHRCELIITDTQIVVKYITSPDENIADVTVTTALIRPKKVHDFPKVLKGLIEQSTNFASLPIIKENDTDGKFVEAVKRACIIDAKRKSPHMEISTEKGELRIDSQGAAADMEETYRLDTDPGDARVHCNPFFVDRFAHVVNEFAICHKRALILRMEDNYYVIAHKASPSKD